MQIVIDIDEDTYKARQHWVANQKRMVDEVDIAIANGTPCDDVISREDVEECKELMTDINGDTVYAVRMSDIRRLLHVNPQETKTGHWIEHKNNGMSYIECSECSSWFLRMYLTRNSFCPNCGAQMIEPQGSEE